jgi:hypothetical protein
MSVHHEKSYSLVVGVFLQLEFYYLTELAVA